MILKYLFSLLILLIGCNNIFNQEPVITTKFKKGEKLSQYFPFDSIKSVELNNIKGDRILNKPIQGSLINSIKDYVFDGEYAHTKPGHIWCLIKFKDGGTLYFY